MRSWGTGVVAIGLACALLAGAPALAGKPDPAEGNFETIEAIDGARFGGPPGPATVRLLMQPRHAGIVVVLPSDGGESVTLPLAWRYSARKQTLNLRIGKLKLAAVFVRGEDGHAVFAGRSWRNMDLPLATAPQPSAAPAPSAAPSPAPAPAPTAAPAPSPTAAPAPSPTAAPAPSPPSDRPPLMAPAPDEPAPSAAPAPSPVPLPAPPAPSPSAAAPLPLPTLPPTPRLPTTPSSSPLAGLWLSSLGRDYIWFIELAGDGGARMGLLRGNRVVASQTGTWSAPSSADHLTLSLPNQTLAGPARTMLTATTGTTLAWSGARWRRP